MNRIVSQISEILQGKKLKKLKIFVINTASDKQLAAELIAMFRENGFLCWDSEHSILPGRLHDTEQLKALYEADIVLGMFTQYTAQTSGRYAALLKKAQDAQIEQPGGVIKFVPILTDGCRLPFEYRQYEPLDMTVSGAAGKLVSALEKRSQTIVINDDEPEAIWL